MTDVRTEIPALAWINAQIIQKAERMGSLNSPTRQVESFYGLPTGSLRILNPAHLIGLLYCLIVVPKELWLKDKSHPVFVHIHPDKIVGLISVSSKTENFDIHPSYTLLRHLRNSVAHARFALVDDKFEFWDLDPRTDRETFRATSSLAQLSEFVSYVGPILANLQNQSLQTH
jgi:hypothetical protein